MATRYITALDYADWRTHNVLRKHAKKRPLGQLECRYHYTQEQPLLSCRSVDIDTSGTGTRRTHSSDRPRTASTTYSDILQQVLVRGGGRTVTSAPAGRSPCRKGSEQTTDESKTQITGNRKGRPKSSSSATTSESFMVLKIDKDMLKTRRAHNELTNQIHTHWRPGSSNLNQGYFRRGQKGPDEALATDAWLSFGGATGEGSEGVVDAFANFQNPEDYYNIGGTVGSRVAQQLQKGDKIRIGINGEVRSHDLRIKKWVKDEQGPEEEEEKEAMKKEAEEKEGADEVQDVQDEEDEDRVDGSRPGSSRENPPSPTTEMEQEEFGDLLFESLENMPEILAEDEEKTKAPESSETKPVPKTPFVDFPLNWDDQVSRPEVKVISPRRGPVNDNRENLCEMHPVIFNTRTRCQHPRPRLASAPSTNGYRIKQRPVSSSSSSSRSSTAARNRMDSASGNKVKAITIDQNSEEEDQRLNDISIEEIIQMRLEIASSAASSPIPGARAFSRARSAHSSTNHLDWDEWRVSATSTPRTPFRFQSATSSSTRGMRSSKSSARPSVENGSPRTPGRSSGRNVPASASRRLGMVPHPSSSVPMRDARNRDLSTVTPVVMSRRSTGRSERQGSGKGPRPMTGTPQYRGPGSGGVASISAGAIPGDTQFIQISQPIRNPNSARVALASGMRNFYSPYPVNSLATSPQPPPYLLQVSPPRSNTSENMLESRSVPETALVSCGDVLADSSRPLTPGDASLRMSQEQDVKPEESSKTPQPEASQDVCAAIGSVEDCRRQTEASSECDAVLPATPIAPVHILEAINIPTGNEVDEEEEEVANCERGESTQLDQHLDQMADMIVGAVLGGIHD